MVDWKWTLPQSVSNHLAQTNLACENLGLLLDKFTPYAEYTWNTRKGQQHGWGIGDGGNKKAQWLQDAIRHSHSRVQEQLLEFGGQRWLERVEKYTPDDKQYFFSLITASSLIVGLGGAHVLETTITLDRNTGAPVIPGSALKGLARTVALIELAQELPFVDSDADRLKVLHDLDDLLSQAIPDGKADEKTRTSYLQAWHALGIAVDMTDMNFESPIFGWVREFQAVFGYVGQAGGVIFFEGICIDRRPRLQIDIMNPHFGKYYGSNQAPRDDDRPIPVTFLTVGKRQSFAFAVVPRHENTSSEARKALEWLYIGLTTLGIGGKTSQGYGLFQEGSS